MTLPIASNSISLAQVNTELGLSSSASINMNASNVRTLFGKPSGAISMSDGWGKSNTIPPVFTPNQSLAISNSVAGPAPCYVLFYPDGTMLYGPYAKTTGPDKYITVTGGTLGSGYSMRLVNVYLTNATDEWAYSYLNLSNSPYTTLHTFTTTTTTTSWFSLSNAMTLSTYTNISPPDYNPYALSLIGTLEIRVDATGQSVTTPLDIYSGSY